MKRVLVIEDSREYRECWKNFFSTTSKFEVEIPEKFASLEELSIKVFTTLLSGGSVIFDNDLGGFGGEFGCYTGSKFYHSLCEMGIWKKVAMSSYDNIEHALNIPKGGGDGKECLAFLEEKVAREEYYSVYFYEIAW